MNEITKTGSASSYGFTNCYASDDAYATFYHGLLSEYTIVSRGSCPFDISLLNDAGDPIGIYKSVYGSYGLSRENYLSFPLDTDGIISYGNNRDKWKAVLTPTIVNSANFGLRARMGHWWYFHNSFYGYLTVVEPDNPPYYYPFRDIYNFGFEIPTDMKIFGIRTTWEGHYTTWLDEAVDYIKDWIDFITITVYYDKQRSIYTIF